MSALTIGFYPDAWQLLTGIAPDQFIDRMVPLDGSIVGPLLAAFKSVFSASSYQQGFSHLETDLTPPWQRCRQAHTPSYLWMHDWITGIAVRAASSGAGKSIRQIQRRIKHWTGQSQLDLNRLARVETLFAKTLSSENSGPVALSGIALDAGFSDQSHMGREVKRVTGASPKQINHLIASNENYWFYRLL